MKKAAAIIVSLFFLSIVLAAFYAPYVDRGAAEMAGASHNC
jgi:hypothetical protein